MTSFRIAFFLWTAALAIAQAPLEVPPDTVVLTVGDVQLTAEQFRAIADTLPEQYRAYASGPGRKQFADEVVKTLILAAEARRQKLDAKPEFQIQSKYRSDELLAKLAQAAISDRAKIDETTLWEYYEAHTLEFERARASHILIRMLGSPVPPKAGARELTGAEALDKARMLGRRVREGEDFAKVAAEESDDPGSSAKGGEIGWFGMGHLAPAFEEAVFQAKAGQILGPVKTEFGYHIIKVEERERKSFDAVKSEIEKKLRPEKIHKMLEDLRERVNTSYSAKFFGTMNRERLARFPG